MALTTILCTRVCAQITRIGGKVGDEFGDNVQIVGKTDLNENLHRSACWSRLSTELIRPATPKP